MHDRLGKELYVGATVLTLQIPIIGQHEFVQATVTRLTAKMVYVQYNHRNRWGNAAVCEYKRYPEQLIIID